MFKNRAGIIILFCTLLILSFLGLYVQKNFSNKSARISIVGDILLDRGVKKQIQSKGEKYPYSEIQDVLKKSDVVIGNLECPITQKGTPVLKDRKLIFKADVSNAAALKAAGFSILNLANNHSMDQGQEGLKNTMNNLSKAGIITVGAGLNRDNASQAKFVKVSNTTLGVLGYSHFPSEGYFFSENEPDVAQVNENIEKNVAEAKRKCDFLIVSIHWGKEFNNYPSDYQIKLAHVLIENGADMIIGHHPHVLQGVEKYKDKFIFYSVGNFVFDKQIPKGTDETIILNLSLDKSLLKQVEILPIRIIQAQPRKLLGKDAQELINKLKKYSKDKNATILFEQGCFNVK
ncbi:MAG: CapA family protein [Deltaproteobacteria bacterium]